MSSPNKAKCDIKLNPAKYKKQAAGKLVVVVVVGVLMRSNKSFECKSTLAKTDFVQVHKNTSTDKKADRERAADSGSGEAV